MEPPEAFTEKPRRARKVYTCDGCYKSIAIGDTYRHMSGIWDGTPNSYKWCLDCGELYDSVHPPVDEECPIRGAHEWLVEYLAESVREYGTLG